MTLTGGAAACPSSSSGISEITGRAMSCIGDEDQRGSRPPALGEVEVHGSGSDGSNSISNGGNCADREGGGGSGGSSQSSIMAEMSSLVTLFSERSRKVLKPHLWTALWSLVPRYGRRRMRRDHDAKVQEAEALIEYAVVNSFAIEQRLVGCNAALKSKAKRLHTEISRSPWLIELISFSINARRNTEDIPGISRECSLAIDDGKPTLSYFPQSDLPKLDIDLTCPVCLETVFDPVLLACGHIFCFLCCCRVASVSTVDGLEAASRKTKCPLCRMEGVFKSGKHMKELNILLKKSCPEYWKERCQNERAERVQQAKDHWDKECRKMVGLI